MNTVALQNKSYAMLNMTRNIRKLPTLIEKSSISASFSQLTESMASTPVYSEDELKDMYVHSVYSQMSMDNIDGIRKAIKDGAIFILLDANESLTFMSDIEKAIADGKSFADALQAQYDKHYIDRFRNDRFDEILIDPKTGAVIDSCSASRGLIIDNTNIVVDYPTCKAIADDLATFIRYTAFPQKGDDPAKVEQLITWIKEKQTTYDISRFDPINDWRNPQLQALAKMLSSTSEKFSLDDNDKSIDRLLDLIRRMQEAQRETDTELSLTDIIRSMCGDEKGNIIDAREKLKADFSLSFSL